MAVRHHRFEWEDREDAPTRRGSERNGRCGSAVIVHDVKPRALFSTVAVVVCAAALGARAASAPWSFTPQVAGISVTDANGRVLAAPFVGGFDVPRPQLVDINGDGKLDLFVQERSGELILF